jgi:hypothetical protein
MSTDTYVPLLLASLSRSASLSLSHPLAFAFVGSFVLVIDPLTLLRSLISHLSSLADDLGGVSEEVVVE